MQVKPSTSANQSLLQLRPGESFYMGKTSLSLVPEEYKDIRLTSSGPSYGSNHQKVSQVEECSMQPLLTSTPRKPYPRDRGLLPTPTEQSHGLPLYTAPVNNHPCGNATIEIKDSSECSSSPGNREALQKIQAPSGSKIRTSTPHSIVREEERGDNRIFNATGLAEGRRSYYDPECTVLAPEGTSHKDCDPSNGIQGVLSIRPPDSMSDNGLCKSPSPRLESWFRIKPPVSSFNPGDRNPLQGNAVSPEHHNPSYHKRPKLMASSLRKAANQSQDSVRSMIEVAAPAATTFIRPIANLPETPNSELRQPSKDLAFKNSLEASTHEIISHPTEHNRMTGLHDSSSRSDLKSIKRSFRRASVRQAASKSPSRQVEISSSIQRTTSRVRDDSGNISTKGAGICILFASSTLVGESKPFLEFLSKHGVKKVESVTDCTLLCVGDEELKKTSKLILAVLLGKEIIKDTWVKDSVREEKLIDTSVYTARDSHREAAWGISLDDAIDRGRQGIKILQGLTIVFTSAAKKELSKGFSDLKEIATLAGAKAVSTALPKKSPDLMPPTILIAVQDDKDLPTLEKSGWKVYLKEIITLSVLRGRLELEDEEFLIKRETKYNSGSKKRKRQR